MLRWKEKRKAMKILAEIYESLSEETIARLHSSSEFKLSANKALKEVLTDKSELALFLSNLGKVNMEYLLNSPDLGRFPSMQDKVSDSEDFNVSISN